MRDLEEEVEALMTSKDVQQKPEARSNMISSLPRPLGPVYFKRHPGLIQTLFSTIHIWLER